MNLPFHFTKMNAGIILGSSEFRTVEPGWSYHQHYHEEFELLLCQKGQIIEWIHGESIEIKAGDWMLISPGIRHSIISLSNDNFSYFYILFGLEDGEMKTDLQSINYVHLQGPFLQLQKLFVEIHWLSTELPLQRIRLYSTMLLLLDEAFQVIFSENERVRIHRRMINEREIEMATTIERMLDEGLQDPITINEIAKRLFVSRSYCNDVFKKVYGITPGQYRSLLKQKMAKELILHTEMSMEAISESLGFSCIGAFSRQFRHWTSLSPLQFRKANKRYL